MANRRSVKRGPTGWRPSEATPPAERGAQRRIFTFGLGSDVNVTLLEQLAMEGRGTAEFVRPDESVERMVGIVANRLVDPILTDVRVRVDGDARLSKLLPATTSDVFADRDLVLFARYSGHGPSRIIVEGNRRGVPVTWTSAVDFPDRERQNPFVARLWAAQRVGFLSAEKRKNGDSREFDDEIRMLGERYGIPTEFTSYLVTEPQFAVMRTAGGAGAPVALRCADGAPASGRERLEDQGVRIGEGGVGAALDELRGGHGFDERRTGGPPRRRIALDATRRHAYLHSARRCVDGRALSSRHERRRESSRSPRRTSI